MSGVATTDGRRRSARLGSLAGILLAHASAAGAGSLTVLSDPGELATRAAALAIELRHEDFESGKARYLPQDQFASCIEPVSSRSEDACFAPGELADGFRLRSSNGYGVIVMGTDLLGADSLAVGGWPYRLTPSSLNYTQVEFAEGPTFVAARVYGFELENGASNGMAAPVTIEAFGFAGQSLGSFVVTPASAGVPAHAAFISNEPVAMVEIGTRQEAAGAVIDDLVFGGGAGRPVIDQAALQFPAIAAGAIEVRLLTVRNGGGLPLALEPPQLPGGPFAVEEEDCSAAAVPANGQCRIWISFQPGHADDFQVDLRVPAASGADPLVVALSGTGLAAGGGQ